MNPLSLLPLPYRLAGAGLMLAIVAGAAALQVHRYGNGREAHGYSRGHAEFTALQTEMSRRALVAEEAARAEEARRLAAQKEIEDAHAQDLQRLRADAVIADAAAGRLQQRVAALVAAARSGGAAADPAAAGGSPAADDPAGVLAELQRRADERAGILARIADESRAAGLACEQSYDALTVR